MSLTTHTRALLVWTSCLLTPVVSVAASPADVVEQKVTQVSLAGLDLSSPAGVRAAHERLHQSARRLCNELREANDLGHVAHFNACVERAMTLALAQLQKPLATDQLASAASR